MNKVPSFLLPIQACRPSSNRLPIRAITSIALLLSLPIVLHAPADLPPGNCAAPQAATDLSQCDFSRKKLAGRDLRGARLALSLIHISEPTRPY